MTDESRQRRVLKLGVIGLGRAFTLMLPTFTADRRVKLCAAADPRPEARALFTSEFGPAYETVEQLCANPEVEAIYVSSPHQMHAEHVQTAAKAGKHVLVEKPIAITIGQCDSMIDAARKAGTHLIVGHSHSFNRPILRLRELIKGGDFGAVRMISALNYTDFLYRPRRPEELVTEEGGGVVFSQAAHQIDIVRLIGGGLVKSVSAVTGSWDRARPTEGAYSALLNFENGAFASAIYNGYGHFDTDELMGSIDEMGQQKSPNRYGFARRTLGSAKTPEAEAALKSARNYGGAGYRAPLPASGLQHQHFGFVLASCENADLRPLPSGVMIYGDETQRLDPLAPPQIPRSEVIDELYESVTKGKPPLHSGEWARATLEVCLAILGSAQESRTISLKHQVPALAE
ncbi:MAG TPA: Gfo/Idh/MocA family oxidoreductase [Xanthobacteraceae bacterium]|nr:Gfo/Idh/MocA family oxidoreductase [Xanthobacteraceae bacterium]